MLKINNMGSVAFLRYMKDKRIKDIRTLKHIIDAGVLKRLIYARRQHRLLNGRLLEEFIK